MASSFIGALDHVCFHSPVCNVHCQPSFHHCVEQACPGVVSTEMAQKAGLVDADGNVKCPCCDCHTAESGERKIVEVHAKLCTDETIHYPEWRKTGRITEEQFQAWKATLTPAELLGQYKRSEDIHVCVAMYDDEAALMHTDLPAFNVLLQQRLREKAETALRYSVPYRKQTTAASITL